MQKIIGFYFSLIILSIILSCEKDPSECSNPDFFNDVESRNFLMGFTTWTYAATNSANDDTYDFILKNGDIYAEQIDEYIPWRSWVIDEALSDDFLLKMEYKFQKKPSDIPLSLSVSLLDTDRTGLLPDRDGWIPEHSGLDDPIIIDAYTKHVKWLVEKFDPAYLIFAMEVNELFQKNNQEWENYKTLSIQIKERIKTDFPNLLISESITLHNWIDPEQNNQEEYNAEMQLLLQNMDFASISFYPFLKGYSTEDQFQQAFDFLQSHIQIPIAFVETNHLAETLELASFNLTIESDPCEQKEYLENLLQNAQDLDFEYIIWWSHRDYDALWETFPEEVKDIGKIWRDTGLLDEDGKERIALDSWKAALEK